MKHEEYSLMAQQQRWHWWYVTKRAYLEQVLRSLNLPNAAKLLDLGAGVGANFSVLRKFGEVDAVEESQAGSTLAKSLALAKVSAADLNTFTPKSSTYNCITILDVLYHQHIQDDVAVLRSALQGLKSDGYLVITDCAHPWLWGPHDVDNMARQRYTKRELEQKIVKAGGVIQRSSYLFAFSFPFFVMGRLIEKWRGRQSQQDSSDDVLNKAMRTVGTVESKLLRVMNIPFGSSILVVAKRA